MGKFVDLTGQKFGRLTVLERVKNDNYGHVRWLCQCECNKRTLVKGYNLKSGHTKSCGCLMRELKKEKFYIHGHNCRNNPSRTYRTWDHMIQRCTNPNCWFYKHYGGRGIRVYKRWLKFENFLQDMGERPENMTLDRVDNNGDYCPENCQWSTQKRQCRNTRSNKLITINGITRCLSEWCEIYQKPYNTVLCRIIRYKWTPEEALELIPRSLKK